MRFTRALLPLALGLLHAALIATPGAARDDYEAPKQLSVRGIASASFAHSFQDTDLPRNSSFDDANGAEVMAGFQTGDYLAFLLSMDWQHESDYDTFFVPLSVRLMSPSLLDRMHLFGQVGIGLFFSQLDGSIKDQRNDNERGSAVRLGGGFEVEISEDWSGIVYGGYLWGLGSTDDYEYGSLGAGIQYRWDF
jgi:hypothetical protein